MNTDWRDIPSLPDFVASPSGLIANAKTGIIKAPSVNAQGVLKVSVTVNRVTTTRSVALLVAEAFLTQPYTEHDNSIIHIDGDRLNCHVDNLARRPRWFAIRYHKQFNPDLESNTLRGHHYHLVETGEHFHTVREVVQRFGLLATDLFISTLNKERVWPGALRFEFVRD